MFNMSKIFGTNNRTKATAGNSDSEQPTTENNEKQSNTLSNER